MSLIVFVVNLIRPQRGQSLVENNAPDISQPQRGLTYAFIAQRNFAERALGFVFDSSAVGLIGSGVISL